MLSKILIFAKKNESQSYFSKKHSKILSLWYFRGFLSNSNIYELYKSQQNENLKATFFGFPINPVFIKIFINFLNFFLYV